MFMAKNLDDCSEVFALSATRTRHTRSNLTPGKRQQDYGNSLFDHRNFFSVVYSMVARCFHSDHGGSNAVLGALSPQVDCFRRYSTAVRFLQQLANRRIRYQW